MIPTPTPFAPCSCGSLHSQSKLSKLHFSVILIDWTILFSLPFSRTCHSSDYRWVGIFVWMLNSSLVVLTTVKWTNFFRQRDNLVKRNALCIPSCCNQRNGFLDLRLCYRYGFICKYSIIFILVNFFPHLFILWQTLLNIPFELILAEMFIWSLHVRVLQNHSWRS